MNTATIPAGPFPLPLTVLWSDELPDGRTVIDTIAAVLAGIHPDDMAIIARFIETKSITRAHVEVSDLWGDAQQAEGRLEVFGQIEVLLPRRFMVFSEAKRRFVLAHELAHLFQYADGITKTDQDDPTNPRTLMTSNGRNLVLLRHGRTWGNSEDLEWDANRRAMAWGFPRPPVDVMHEATLVGAVRIGVYRRPEALHLTAADLVETFNVHAKLPNVEFYLEPHDPDELRLDEVGS